VWAVERYVEAAISEDRRPVAVTPELGRIFLWTVYDREGDRVRAWRVDSRTGHVTLAFEYVDMAATPAARVSRELPMVQHFLALSILPFAQAQQVGERHLVLWSDLTTCSMRGCDLSFGGAFDAHMTALYQFVQIGGFTQRRPPAAR
jgi:hypothetical protein